MTHGIENLCRYDHRHAGVTGAPRQVLLDTWYVLEWDLQAEIAACHHDRVGLGKDVVEPGEGLRTFYLRHQPEPCSAAPGSHLARPPQVVSALHEANPHEVDSHRHGSLDLTGVGSGNRRHRDLDAGGVDSLPGTENAAVLNPCDDLRPVAFYDLQCDPAVVEQECLAAMQGGRQWGARGRHPGCVAGEVSYADSEAAPRLQQRSIRIG